MGCSSRHVKRMSVRRVLEWKVLFCVLAPTVGVSFSRGPIYRDHPGSYIRWAVAGVVRARKRGKIRRTLGARSMWVNVGKARVCRWRSMHNESDQHARDQTKELSKTSQEHTHPYVLSNKVHFGKQLSISSGTLTDSTVVGTYPNQLICN